MNLYLIPLAGAALALALSLPSAIAASAAPAAVDSARIAAADKEPGNWLSYGRTYSEQRFSPLDQINDRNASQLGLAWYLDLDSARGQEATPLVIDGVMYTSTAWSMVKAIDAATGKLKWAFDPQVPRDWAVKACCDAVNRGVAAYRGKIYVGTLDGRLIALNAAIGKVVWSVQTTDPAKPYTITGAPRIVKDKVLIGNGGAEFGVRGYISAYDAKTGNLDWRFYTIPGKTGFEQPILKTALATWKGAYSESSGGTVWDAISYDPELNLVYFGAGNGTPWSAQMRSPGGGDNLFLASIVAVNADTGAYVWHYQVTPGDEWDYDADQQLTLADLNIDGKPRKVIMQASKNGFFYVLDRATGKLISAKNYATVNWTTGIDPNSGRPIEVAKARYSENKSPWVNLPGPLGAHNWQPMSFDPQTGLVYIPAQDTGFPFIAEAGYKAAPIGYNIGLDFAAASLPNDAKVKAQALAGLKGELIAWDPVAQREVWRVQHKGPWNGGVLSTAGNLVAQGNATGEFAVYRADNGQKLWSMKVQTGVLAAPMTYLVNGQQYIAVLAGWGGAYALADGALSFKSGHIPNISRVLAFRIGGTAKLPPPPPNVDQPLNPPPSTANAKTITTGKAYYSRFCGVCHGDAAVSGGLVPDLRYSANLPMATWRSIVLGGQLRQGGMPSFASALDPAKVSDIRGYVIARANEDKPSAPQPLKKAGKAAP
ncbi:MAG TPA: PQQ-dependent dehydrogenase, methanol/ethanol family [Rhizomicrobium sp.]|jgi:alcohol dehydrogenase (cytochrome c)/quinohemoprotein ethanol dehydrogenase